MILLDSSVLIELFRKKSKQDTLFYKLAQSENDFSISSVTYYEIGIGNRKNHKNYWEKLCERLMVIPFDKACADSAITIYQNLKHKNKLLDLADLLIGATAITHEMPIATLNVNHFQRIEDLTVLQ